MQNSVEIFSIALGLVEPWYVKEVVFDKEPPLPCESLPRSRANPFAWHLINKKAFTIFDKKKK